MSPEVVTVAVSRIDGGLTVVRIVTTEYAANGSVNWSIDPTDEYIEKIIAKHDWKGPQAPLSWRRVPNDFVDESTDRTFRNAWKDGPGKPDVDMPKAREIHRDRLRIMRQPLLEALDVEYLKADEEGRDHDKRGITARKQALRSVTDDARIELAETPEALKAAVPEALK